MLAGSLAGALFVSAGQNPLAAQMPTDPAHAAHVAAGAMPPGMVMGDPTLAQLQAKVAQLEAALAQSMPPMAAAPAGAAMPGMPGAAAPTTPPMSMGMDKMNSGGGMAGMNAGATPAPPTAGMSGGAAPAGGMMAMMSQMMGMMDKMMSMGGTPAPMPSTGATPSGGGMGMDVMKMGGGAMPAAPGGGMSGGGGMAMMGMTEMGGGSSTMTQSALPGFPGASHLYHIGATDFFLDHPQHIALSTEQQAGLNKAKEQALLAKSTTDRAVEQAEQVLWTLTAAAQPDATQVEAKIREIEKLRGDERLSFIRAVGDASRILTDEQRRILTGFAPPAPAAAPMAGAMKDM